MIIINGYKENLNTASELYLKKKQIPDSVLIKLVPKNYPEFDLYYGTTYPGHRLYETPFFYETSQMIFEKVIDKKNDEFYMESLKLISFSDGEFSERFTNYLELIIEMDNLRFCQSILGKEYANYNPIKWYAEANDCK